MATKNLVEDALIQIKNLEEVINENAKEILQSTMKEEISELVKESIKEADEDEKEESPNEDESEIEDEDEIEVDDLDSDENDDQDGMEFGGGMDFSNGTPTIDLTKGATNQEVANVFKRLKDTDEVIVVRDGDNIDLTVGGEEYIIKLNEGMYMDEDEDVNPADDAIPMEEDEEMDMEFTGDEELEEDFDDEDMDREEMFNRIFAEMDETNEDDTETVYELEMDGEELPSGEEELEEDFDDMNLDDMNYDDVASYEDEESDEEFEEGWMNESRKTNKKTVKPVGKGIGKPKFDYKKTTGGFKEKMKQGTKGVGMGKAKFEYKESDNKMKKVETKEAARTYGYGSKDKSRGLRKGITPNRNLTFESYEKLVEEISSLRQKNEEYRKALNLFREKLNEVAIFNSNLAYATRLFTEHSTSKQEKINILRRFDSVDTIKESKKLYKFIKEELDSNNDKGTINEAFDRVVNVEPQTGSAVNLIESKTYENPQFLRMKDLMTKIIK
jgi:hypothetical protein